MAPATDALARLRIFQNGILSVNVVLRLKVIRIRGSPVAIQSRSNLSAIVALLRLEQAYLHPSYMTFRA